MSAAYVERWNFYVISNKMIIVLLGYHQDVTARWETSTSLRLQGFWAGPCRIDFLGPTDHPFRPSSCHGWLIPLGAGSALARVVSFQAEEVIRDGYPCLILTGSGQDRTWTWPMRRVPRGPLREGRIGEKIELLLVSKTSFSAKFVLWKSCAKLSTTRRLDSQWGLTWKLCSPNYLLFLFHFFVFLPTIFFIFFYYFFLIETLKRFLISLHHKQTKYNTKFGTFKFKIFV